MGNGDNLFVPKAFTNHFAVYKAVGLGVPRSRSEVGVQLGLVLGVGSFRSALTATRSAASSCWVLISSAGDCLVLSLQGFIEGVRLAACASSHGAWLLTRHASRSLA